MGLSNRYGLVILASVCVNYFIENFLRTAPSALSPILIESLGISYGVMGLLLSSYSLLYSVMQVPAGILSDGLGPRKTIIGFTLVSVVGVFLFYLGSSIEVLLAAQMLIGLGGSVFYINAIKLVSNWFPPEKRASAVGILSAALGLGSFTAYIGFPITMNMTGGWRSMYLFFSAMLAANLIVNFLIIRDSPKPLNQRRDSNVVSLRQTLKSVLQNNRLYPLIVGYILSSLNWAFLSWIPQFLTDSRGFSYIDVGIVSSAGTLSGIPGCILITAISDKLRKRKSPLVAFSAVYTFLLVVFLYLPGWIPQVVFAVVAAAIGFSISLWVLLIPMVSESLPPEMEGVGLGVLNTAGTLGITLISPVYGMLVDRSGGYSLSNTIILIGGVLMTLIYAFCTSETYSGEGKS